MGLIASSSSLAVKGQNGLKCTIYPLLCSTVNPEGLIVFWKNFVSSSGELSDRSKVFHSSPRSFYAPFFSILLLMVSFWWSCRYGGYEGKPASHILLSQRPDPKEKQVINLDQDVQVCGYFRWVVDELLLYDFSLPCIIIIIIIILVWLYFSFLFF